MAACLAALRQFTPPVGRREGHFSHAKARRREEDKYKYEYEYEWRPVLPLCDNSRRR